LKVFSNHQSKKIIKQLICPRVFVLIGAAVGTYWNINYLWPFGKFMGFKVTANAYSFLEYRTFFTAFYAEHGLQLFVPDRFHILKD